MMEVDAFCGSSFSSLSLQCSESVQHHPEGEQQQQPSGDAEDDWGYFYADSSSQEYHPHSSGQHQNTFGSKRRSPWNTKRRRRSQTVKYPRARCSNGSGGTPGVLPPKLCHS
mmetsp:Transcript_37259/g.77325  ORF Transcript_37259/g.77325 Transcript_37259/m.77325 type:complete len:112 (-) Transcript_37259:226-561(-)